MHLYTGKPEINRFIDHSKFWQDIRDQRRKEQHDENQKKKTDFGHGTNQQYNSLTSGDKSNTFHLYNGGGTFGRNW